MSGQEKKVVLVVDDAPANIRVVNEILRNTYKVRVATNGDKALELASESPSPDLILLDVLMPGMDGYEVCTRLKADPATQDIPIIFLTGQTETSDETRGFDVGAVDYIAAGETKPQVRMESRATIRTMALQNFQGRLAGVTTRHYQTGIVFDALSLNSARTRTMVLATHQGASDAVPRLSHTGVYDDQWRKTQEGWRFVHHTFRPDHSVSWATQ